MLQTDRWDEQYRGAYLGNGFLGQRVMQSGLGIHPGGVQPGFVAGNYNSEESLEAVPTLTPLEIRCGNRTWGTDAAHARTWRQELRLREGRLVTAASWDTGAGTADLSLSTAFLRPRIDRALVVAEVRNHGSRPVELGIAGLPGPASDAGAPAGEIRLTFLQEPLNGVAALAVLEGQATPGPSGYSVAPGDAVTAVLVLQVRPTRDTGVRPEALPAVTRSVVDGWLQDHREWWDRFWTRDIEIDGDPEAQQVVRACLFQLACAVNEWGEGIPPMGLSSNAFSGHVFWDMDSWMLPALLPQHPEYARSMLDYRYRTLDGARANARAEGLPGASYAWESGRTGREALRHGEFVHGRHVSGDVALAIRQYWAATGDDAWVREYGWPILKETADNWVARARKEGSGYVIRGVTTPDELAGRVDHSAWTHHVARVNLELAGEAARLVGKRPNPRWAEVGAGLSFLRDPTSRRILPYAGWTDRSRAKQADLLLLIHPGELELDRSEMADLYDYYAPRVIRTGPAMTDAIHAVVAARLGRGQEALDRFRASYRPFVRPPYHAFSEKRTRDNLNFLTGAAGTVGAVLYGFAGLHIGQPSLPGTDSPQLKPLLPPGWNALRLRSLHWRGRVWDVTVRPGEEPRWVPHAGDAPRPGDDSPR